MSYRPEWIFGAGVVFIAALAAPPFALIALGVLLLAAVGALLAIAAAIAATPYLLFRSVRRRWAQNHTGHRSAQPASRALTLVPSKET